MLSSLANVCLKSRRLITKPIHVACPKETLHQQRCIAGSHRCWVGCWKKFIELVFKISDIYRRQLEQWNGRLGACNESNKSLCGVDAMLEKGSCASQSLHKWRQYHPTYIAAHLFSANPLQLYQSFKFGWQ